VLAGLQLIRFDLRLGDFINSIGVIPIRGAALDEIGDVRNAAEVDGDQLSLYAVKVVLGADDDVAGFFGGDGEGDRGVVDGYAGGDVGRDYLRPRMPWAGGQACLKGHRRVVGGENDAEDIGSAGWHGARATLDANGVS